MPGNAQEQTSVLMGKHCLVFRGTGRAERIRLVFGSEEVKEMRVATERSMEDCGETGGK